MLCNVHLMSLCKFYLDSPVLVRYIVIASDTCLYLSGHNSITSTPLTALIINQEQGDHTAIVIHAHVACAIRHVVYICMSVCVLNSSDRCSRHAQTHRNTYINTSVFLWSLLCHRSAQSLYNTAHVRYSAVDFARVSLSG